MILTVTLNPLLERRYFFKKVTEGKGNRATDQDFRAGGKGINVSRQLNVLKVKNHVFTFFGGKNGKLFKEILSSENIDYSSIQTKTETRDGTVTVNNSSNSVTTFFGINSKITKEEVAAFKTKLEKMIVNCEIVVFSGSSPCENTDSIFPFGIAKANEYNKISVCDTYGRHLENCIYSTPTIIHNNISEIENTFNISLSNEKEKLDYLRSLYKKNIKQVYLTDGSNPFYCSNFDYHFKITPPQIKTVDALGSGDSFTAGIIYTWHNKLTFEEGLKIATSLGVLNAASANTSQADFIQAQKIFKNIIVNSVGKKMIKIDATPT
ncbi:MAG: 1-phosphofructokinase [Ignavibacteriales bacterium CG12_big_fil_rev_8_21_14_0_65_30_8]|nr:MAG: 1-phosphofructokinase [Ignavibacteriales bacterium CG12_big_fil_rev_8_21_14_0_65_30_8]